MSTIIPVFSDSHLSGSLNNALVFFFNKIRFLTLNYLFNRNRAHTMLTRSSVAEIRFTQELQRK